MRNFEDSSDFSLNVAGLDESEIVLAQLESQLGLRQGKKQITLSDISSNNGEARHTAIKTRERAQINRIVQKESLLHSILPTNNRDEIHIVQSNVPDLSRLEC